LANPSALESGASKKGYSVRRHGGTVAVGTVSSTPAAATSGGCGRRGSGATALKWDQRFESALLQRGVSANRTYSIFFICDDHPVGAGSTAKFPVFSQLAGLAKLPSHRILALFRGEKEEVLSLEPGSRDRGEPSAFERQIANRFNIADQGRPGDRWLIDTVRATASLGRVDCSAGAACR
jgi:hypothetical protein